MVRVHAGNVTTVRGTVAYRQEEMLNDAIRIGVGFRGGIIAKETRKALIGAEQHLTKGRFETLKRSGER